MSLRLQLLAFVALTLFLPWAGLRIVEAMEESLRLGLESSLERSARSVAQAVAGTGVFAQRNVRAAGVAAPLYVHPLSRQPLLDGKRGDWRFLHDRRGELAAAHAVGLGDVGRLWLGTHSSFLYLFAEVDDDSVVLQAGPDRAPYGDRLVLLFGRDPANPSAMLLASQARAALVSAQPSAGAPDFAPAGRFDDTTRAFWLTEGGRYSVEARIPLRLLDGTLGVGVIDTDPGDTRAVLAASTWSDAGAPNLLVGESAEISRVLRPYAGRSDAPPTERTERYRVIDGEGWVLADTGPLEDVPAIESGAPPSLTESFFRRFLRRDDPEYAATLEGVPGRITDPDLLRVLDGASVAAWYRRGADASAIVAAAVPIEPDFPERGAVVIEEASDPILTLTNRAMLRLVTTTVIVSLVAAAALLAYASFLSFRVRRLARAAESALGPRGEIRARLPGARARDEIGDLARSFEDLLGRLRDYTEYLQSLKSKLSHELRTPLAIVSTSLDNLEQETRASADKTYLARLRQGADRLEAILQAMTAATRVEQAIGQTQLERFEVTAVVAGCVSAYRDVYPAQRFALAEPGGPAPIDGSPELIAQLLDKLVDNAAGFAAEGSTIEIGILASADEIELTVTNRGPLLPESMRHQLFDSLVSVRDDRTGKAHLGLGLYIAQLIAEFHGGRVEASNLADGSGVRMRVVLPRGDAGAA